MDPERETKFRSAFGELRPWVDASLTVAKALLTQSRHYYCLGRGPTKGGELPVSLPSAGVLIRALGLAVPPSLLAQANDVIE